MLLFLRVLLKKRIVEAQIVQRLKNNEARPKFTGSYKKACINNYNNNKHDTLVALTHIESLHRSIILEG